MPMTSVADLEDREEDAAHQGQPLTNDLHEK